jgi:hypothetical protein
VILPLFGGVKGVISSERGCCRVGIDESWHNQGAFLVLYSLFADIYVKLTTTAAVSENAA